MRDALVDLLASVDAFDFDGMTYSYGDAVAMSELWGQELVAPPAPPTAGFASAIVAFRRARGLLSAEEYREWLALRRIDTHAVEAYLLGTPADTPEAMRAALILSGTLTAWAVRLSGCAAAARALGVELAGLSPAARREALAAAEAAFRAQQITAPALAACLRRHALDWRHLEWDELTLETEGAARECALWVRADGLDLADVAALAGGRTVRLHALACDLAAGTGPLLGAAVGEIIGPLAEAGRWRVAELRERRAPEGREPELLARAEAELIGEALERHRAGRVSWHVRL